MDYFSNGNWSIYIDETLKVADKMNKADRQIFNCDMREFEWEDYLLTFWRGIRKYILQETIDPIKERSHHIKLWLMHYSFLTLVSLSSIYFIANRLF